LLALATLTSCADAPPPAPTTPTCEAKGITAAMQAVAPDAIAVHLDVPSSKGMDIVRADLASYLGQMWGTGVPIAAGAPDFSLEHTVWISSSAEAQALAGTIPAEGYVIRRLAHAGSEVLLVAAADEAALTTGAYALLEELGARFFHPKDELVPHLGGVFLPSAIDVARKPAFALRGVQLHTLHPIEYFRAFLEPGEQNLKDALRFVDWIAKTGQNEVQFWLLSDIDLAAWRPHAEAIIAHAHDRGIKVGAMVHLSSEGSLQKGYELVQDPDNWQAGMDARIDALLEVPFDLVEMGMGEFLAGDPNAVVTWLDHATAYMADKYPGKKLSVTNHIGNFPDLWVDYNGQKTFYYHLPGFADPRLVNDVHTVFFFDLYRPWAAYAHEDFFLHREFLFEQLSKREMWYKPESAYWVSADVDVPLFLPSYIEARWNDIHGLVADTKAMGLPPLGGHVMFSSGHEWGYWLTDYLSARMMWEPEKDLRHFIGHATHALGTCGESVETGLVALVDAQREFLFDKRLVGYMSGEDLQDDLGALAGFVTMPVRIGFGSLQKMSESERQAFEKDVIGGLEAFAGATADAEAILVGACARPDVDVGRFCREFADGAEIVRLRAEQTALLYRAALDHARGGGAGASLLAEARQRTEAAARVVARREKDYRFPLAEVVEPWPNPTIYHYGYLRQAHTLCYWQRREEEVRFLLEEGQVSPPAALPTCLN
jgi:hypothetical protein